MHKKKSDNKQQYKYSTFENLSYSLSGAWKHKKGVSFCVVIQAITVGLCSFVWLYTAKFIIGQIETQTNSSFSSILWVVLIAAIIELILLIGREISYRQIEAGMLQVRMQFILMSMKKVFALPYEMMENPDVLDAKRKGDWAIENMTRGIEGIVKDASQMFANLVIMLVATVILVQVNPIIAVIMFALAIWRVWFEDKAAQFEKEELYDRLMQEHRKSHYYNQVTRDFEYAKDIRLFVMKKALSEKQAAILNTIYTRLVLIQNKWRSCWIRGSAVAFLQEAVMYAWLVFEVIAHGMTIADFTLYVGSVRSFSNAIGMFLDYFARMRQNSRQICDYRTFIEYTNIITTKKSNYCKDYCQLMERKGAKEEVASIPNYDSYSFRFENVSFHYPGREEYALMNLNLTLQAGKRLAVVGLNGAGKSTFIKLLCRLYEPTEGTIYLNGTDIRQFDRGEYYKLIAPVFQNVECFAFPLAENVSMQEPKHTDLKWAKECLEKAGLKEKIASLPSGVETQMLRILHDDGMDLSGGEKQKMLLAKALYKNAPVVVLDEPTAALDALAEYKTYQDFDKLIGNRTAVYISHRLSSTRFCHNVAMFTGGKLIEYGTHEELLQANGEYAKMFEVQSQYYKEEVGEYA